MNFKVAVNNYISCVQASQNRLIAKEINKELISFIGIVLLNCKW